MGYLIGIVCAFFSYQAFATSLTEDIKSLFASNYEEQVNNTSFPDTREAINKSVFIFDPQHFLWAVYDKNGKRVGIGKASGGADYCADINEPCRTVEGEYTVFRKEDADCTSKTFPIDEGGGAPMPHCMFFYKGYAIHGSSNVFSENRSHGCIRVTKKAAEWMNSNYINPGSLVIVMPYKKQEV